MDSPGKNRQPSSGDLAAVTAPTLTEALRLAHLRFGREVRVVCSRTIAAPLAAGRQPRRLVEVVVVPAGSAGQDRAGWRGVADRSTGRAVDNAEKDSARPSIVPPSATRSDVQREIAQEVARIESAADALQKEYRRLAAGGRPVVENRVGQALLAAGTSPQTVQRLMDRFVAETGGEPCDHHGLYNYLVDTLPASGGDWDLLDGVHVFLGPDGCGKTEIVLDAAGRLQDQRRRTLVLSLSPRHAGEIRRLQQAAAQHGYDAAILTDGKQLATGAAHFGDYDAVLIDTPSVTALAMSKRGELHDQIVQNADFARHFVVPLDIDLQDATSLWTAARGWNCDWLTLTRLDLTARPGKLLDLCVAAQLPVSLLGEGPWPDGSVRPVTSRELCALILAVGDPDALSGGQDTAAGVAG